MVVFLNLNDDKAGRFEATEAEDFRKSIYHDHLRSVATPSEAVISDRPNPNLNGFSQALACYP